MLGALETKKREEEFKRSGAERARQDLQKLRRPSLGLGPQEMKEAEEEETNKKGEDSARREMRKLRRRLVKWTILAEFW